MDSDQALSTSAHAVATALINLPNSQIDALLIDLAYASDDIDYYEHFEPATISACCLEHLSTDQN